jgi:hypothetical protein
VNRLVFYTKTVSHSTDMSPVMRLVPHQSHSVRRSSTIAAGLYVAPIYLSMGSAMELFQVGQHQASAPTLALALWR